ncbi:hypothetical protein OA542_01345 [Opitutae bacterium]|nr:hypothetical protein [Opitutae bacterium]
MLFAPRKEIVSGFWNSYPVFLVDQLNEPWYSQDLETITTVQVITKSGLPEKRTFGSKSKPWANYWEEGINVVYGHTPRMRIFKKRNTLCIDTGCVYGGKLTAYSVEEDRLISVKAKRTYC